MINLCTDLLRQGVERLPYVMLAVGALYFVIIFALIKISDRMD